MAKRGNCHNVGRIADAVGASTPSASASVPNLQIEYLRPERLRPSPNNARTHSKKQLKQIARSIERFGFVNPVLIADDFEIVAGHGRIEAAKMLGLKEVPTVRLSNLSPAERRTYIITDNRLAELAGWDRDVLAIELQGLLDLEFDDVELTGFSIAEIDLILEEFSGKERQARSCRGRRGGKPRPRAAPGRFTAGRSLASGAAPPPLRRCTARLRRHDPTLAAPYR